VLFCDIDGFTTINDQYGNSAGDAVLQTIAERKNTSVPCGDIAARFGGDELLVLLYGVHELTNALGIADKIRRAAAEPVNTDGLRLTATLSLGVTLAVPGESVDTRNGVWVSNPGRFAPSAEGAPPLPLTLRGYPDHHPATVIAEFTCREQRSPCKS
jgi:hypothetical protein